MEYISTKEASAKWGISTTRITILANEGRIPGAQRLGKSWLIPANASKPPMLKANSKKEAGTFSFPLYHFRPDWNSAQEERLSAQQHRLFQAESFVLSCRFADAYPLLESILAAPDDIYTEIGSLWNAGICCIALNKPEEFSKIFLRLQILLSKDFPYRNDLVIILDTLKTYVETMGASASKDTCDTDVHDQCLALTCIQIGYANMSKEAMKPGSADTPLLEVNLRLLKNTSAIIATEMMHIYLLGIYYLRRDMISAEKHAKAAIKIAYENSLYFPLVTYYRYFASVLSPLLAQYPVEFQDHCHMMVLQFEKNFADFLSSINEYSVFSKLTDSDYPFIYAVLMEQSNTYIADKLGLHPQTVQNRLARLCKKLGVKSKKELSDFLHNYM